MTPIEYTLSICPVCGAGSQKAQKRSARIVQQVSLPTQPIKKIEHRGNAYWCPRCHHSQPAECRL
ncbi:MAG: IS66 family transposase zinc-finger binding domain-containing protein [Chitinivibrionales bacterium]|nr:IS66 family transposase zinc-finger binding domain-containing protein [Chitinivibrionales bacterium]